MTTKRTMTRSATLCIACASFTCALVSTATAALPTDAPGFIVDGDRIGAAFSASDGSAVSFFDVASGRAIGEPLALPDDPTGDQDRRWRTVSLRDEVLYVAREHNGVQALLSLDSRTRAVRVICGSDFAAPACPGAGGTSGLTLQQVGKRWFTATTAIPADLDNGVKVVQVLYRYRQTGDGYVTALASPTQARAFRRRLPSSPSPSTPQNLSSTVPTLDRRWGYDRSVSVAGAATDTSYRLRIQLARPNDRKSSRIELRRSGLRNPQVAFGRRGMCAIVGKRVVLWDRTTRRVWRRSARPDLVDVVSCTRNRVILSSGPTANGSPGHIATPWKWPERTASAGWQSSGTLRAGQMRSYR